MPKWLRKLPIFGTTAKFLEDNELMLRCELFMSQQQWVTAQFAQFVLNVSSNADSNQKFLSFWKPLRSCRVSWMRLPCFVQPFVHFPKRKKASVMFFLFISTECRFLLALKSMRWQKYLLCRYLLSLMQQRKMLCTSCCTTEKQFASELTLQALSFHLEFEFTQFF